jgi:hypothetical protein
MTTGKNEDDRSCTDPIESEHAFTSCLLVYYWVMSDIISQLLLEKSNNEQPLERLLKWK